MINAERKAKNSAPPIECHKAEVPKTKGDIDTQRGMKTNPLSIFIETDCAVLFVEYRYEDIIVFNEANRKAHPYLGIVNIAVSIAALSAPKRTQIDFPKRLVKRYTSTLPAKLMSIPLPR